MLQGVMKRIEFIQDAIVEMEDQLEDAECEHREALEELIERGERLVQRLKLLH